MKKRFLLIFLILFTSIGLVSCNKDKTSGPVEIKIMHGAVNEIDPFHENYSGTEQAERQKLQKEVEEDLGIKIRYVSYPDDAAWGPSRQNAIINWHVQKQPKADIYWVTSLWLGALANSKAIVPVTKYLDEVVPNIDDTVKAIGSYKGEVYGVRSGAVTNEDGLFINTDLLKSKNLEDPVDLYNRGEWTWSGFEEWANKAKRTLSSDEGEFVLGGVGSQWAEALVPLNGGRLVDVETETVGIASNEAIDTYEKLHSWWKSGFFDPDGKGDQGSASWLSGKILLHPGSLWFLKADNRWGNTEFSKGVVPFPVSDEYDGEYLSPATGEALFTVANSNDPEREKLALEVWSRLQLWKTEEELQLEAKNRLLGFFDEEKYVNVFQNIYYSTYPEIIHDLGVGKYEESGWNKNVNQAVREGSSRSIMESIRPVYAEALRKYLE